MVFPAVCAAALVGAHANGTAMIVSAVAVSVMAARIDIFVCARWTARISSTFRYETESCLAQRERGCQPVGGRNGELAMVTAGPLPSSQFDILQPYG
jgi:hypothetical protein